METVLPPEKNPHSLIIPLVVILLGLILGGSLLYLKVTYPALFTNPVTRLYRKITSSRRASPTPTPLASPTPPQRRSPLPLPTGPQTYTFSRGKNVAGPAITSLTLDPLTPASGTPLTLTLKATHPNPITSVVLEIITDNATTPLTLAKTAGTDTNGTWQATTTLTDTYVYRYGLHFLLTSEDSVYDDTMWLNNY